MYYFIFFIKLMSKKGLFQKDQNTFRCPFKILHKHCFKYFLLEQLLLQVPREIEKKNVYAKFWRDNKEYCAIFWKRPIVF